MIDILGGGGVLSEFYFSVVPIELCGLSQFCYQNKLRLLQLVLRGSSVIR